jgi:hypothetical protein
LPVKLYKHLTAPHPFSATTKYHPSTNPPLHPHTIDAEIQQDNPNTNTMDMMMKLGAPRLTQPGSGHNRFASFDSTHSGSDSSDGGVALNLPTAEQATTNNSTRKTRLSKHARKALRSREASASTRAGIEPSPVVAVTPTTTNKMKANNSAPKSRPSKMARKALRRRKAAASASTGTDHEPPSVFEADPTTTEQATTSGSKRNARLSKKARKTLRRRKAAAAAAHTADAPPADSHRTDTNPADVPADAPDGVGNDAVTEIAAIITETELHVLRAIEAKCNALGARLDENHARQMTWTEEKIREHRESGYGYGTMFFFLIIFLMTFATYTEAEERRKSKRW